MKNRLLIFLITLLGVVGPHTFGQGMLQMEPPVLELMGPDALDSTKIQFVKPAFRDSVTPYTRNYSRWSPVFQTKPYYIYFKHNELNRIAVYTTYGAEVFGWGYNERYNL